MGRVKVVKNMNVGHYGKTFIRKPFGVLGKLVGPDNQSGPGIQSRGVRIRGRGRR